MIPPTPTNQLASLSVAPGVAAARAAERTRRVDDENAFDDQGPVRARLWRVAGRALLGLALAPAVLYAVAVFALYAAIFWPGAAARRLYFAAAWIWTIRLRGALAERDYRVDAESLLSILDELRSEAAILGFDHAGEMALEAALRAPRREEVAATPLARDGSPIATLRASSLLALRLKAERRPARLARFSARSG